MQQIEITIKRLHFADNKKRSGKEYVTEWRVKISERKIRRYRHELFGMFRSCGKECFWGGRSKGGHGQSAD